jgi:hypothetical protein
LPLLSGNTFVPKTSFSKPSRSTRCQMRHFIVGKGNHLLSPFNKLDNGDVNAPPLASSDEETEPEAVEKEELSSSATEPKHGADRIRPTNFVTPSRSTRSQPTPTRRSTRRNETLGGSQYSTAIEKSSSTKAFVESRTTQRNGAATNRGNGITTPHADAQSKSETSIKPLDDSPNDWTVTMKKPVRRGYGTRDRQRRLQNEQSPPSLLSSL